MAEPAVPNTDVGEPTASVLAWVEGRMSTIDRDMHRLRLQMVFLFAFLTAALVVAAVRGQVNDNRIELERWQLCQDRVAAVTVYNANLPTDAIRFPVAQCGPDPRTD